MIRILALSLSCFLCSSVAFAQEEVLFASGSPLDSYQSHIVYPLLKEAFRRNGIKFDAKSFPSARSLLMSNSGTVDGDLHRAENFHEVSHGKYPHLVRIECELVSVTLSVFSTKKDVEVKKWADLQGSKIGYLYGSNNIESCLNGVVAEDNIFLQPTEFGLFKMLARGYLDYVIIDEVEGRKLIKLNPKFNCIKDVGKLNETKIYAYMNDKHRKLAKQVGFTLNEMKKDGSFQKIVVEMQRSYCLRKDCEPTSCKQRCFIASDDVGYKQATSLQLPQ